MSQMYEPSLPAFRANTEDDARQARALLDASIMIVDDEPMMIEVTQTYLEDAGYSRFVSVTDPNRGPTHCETLIRIGLPDRIS